MGKEQDIHREAQSTEAVVDEKRDAGGNIGDKDSRPGQDEAASAGPGDIAAQVPAEGAGQAAVELIAAQARAEQHWNDLLRVRAEIANLQRRAERDVENAYKYSLEKFAAELIPVIDSLEAGLVVVSESPSPDIRKIREGMELTLKLMTAAVSKFGIKAIDPRGDRFDPALHQAMSVQSAAGVEPNRVINVYQKGYMLNDRLIRPAMVVVSGPGGEAEEPDGSPAGGGFDATA